MNTPADRTPQFVRLLAHHEREIHAFILSLLSNWADADDVWQETSVRLWDQFDKYVDDTDFAAWAKTVAKYQVLTYRKRRGRQRQQFSESFVEHVARIAAARSAPAPSPTARDDALANCLKRLPDRNRELLFAYYAPGAAVRDVASQWGRTAESLKVTVFRIRRALHECIQREIRIESR